jgi:hypothetical protein
MKATYKEVMVLLRQEIRMGEELPVSLPKKYSEKIENILKRLYFSKSHARKIVYLLTWQGAKALKQTFEIDLQKIMNEWHHELAGKMTYHSLAFHTARQSSYAEWILLAADMALLSKLESMVTAISSHSR